jgi:hypothetical protein
MNSFATGVDVPLSQMPAGMAFDSAESGGSGGFGDIGKALLGGLGKGVLGALSSGGSSGTSGSGRSSTPYTDRTKDLLAVLISQAVDAFASPESTIS